MCRVENPWKNAAFLKYIPYLVDNLSCRTIRLACAAKGLISSTEKTKLMNIEDPNAHNDDLVDMLCRGDASSFHSFLEIIRDNEPKGNFREFLHDMKAIDKGNCYFCLISHLQVRCSFHLSIAVFLSQLLSVCLSVSVCMCARTRVCVCVSLSLLCSETISNC